MRFQVHIELQEKRLESLKEKELNQMHNRIEDTYKESTKQTTCYAEINMKVDKALKRLEPLHDRMKENESFMQRGLPLLTHLQISDALQEFLCLHDQIKLIQYDNDKLSQFTESLLPEDPNIGDTTSSEEDEDAKDDKVSKETEPASTT